MACPWNSLMGDTLLRRSHSCRLGDMSSSEATISCVATSGFHCTTEQRLRLPGKGGMQERMSR